MKISNLNITLDSITGDDTGIIKACDGRKWEEWKDGKKTGRVLGIVVSVISVRLKTSVDIKIRYPDFGTEVFRDDEEVMIQLDGFRGRLYQDFETKAIRLTCEAERGTLIDGIYDFSVPDDDD